ncbi:hypothetical protein OIB37_20975 [Streptomyces sp. NBC_00820]|uniref:hypothetical protein n=1 Tax=Streptomyces sp. NBC_00820 TaxID=2975842 RepID=UPI002ED4ACA5|nr:hypothetical protein OIB37_20975 [Streptomyces sp. NBC_00820]
MCQPPSSEHLGGVLWGRDYAYVHPAVVGRLTAAVRTYALNGRRFGGRTRISLQESGAGRRGGGLDQEVEWR